AFDGQIGVFAGAGMNTYLLKNLLSNPDLIQSLSGLQIAIGNDKDFVPTQVSYKLNLKGPSVNVNTACSSSLVTVQMGCQSLLNYECNLVMAGGVSVNVPQKEGYLYQQGSILSPDGHCRAFDANAQGCIDGSGVGIVVLKRLEDALADRDNILAVIKGSAINNDGSLKVSYTAPSVEGQAAVIAEAQAMAGIDVETINYIETHGTGTDIGDPIEIAALTQAFRVNTQKKGFCAIASVKTNIGHLGAAAGVAGLIKTVLALKYKQIPPSLHYEQPNPKINFAKSPFYVNTKLSEWKTDGTPRRAGVSSFGIGGTNCHLILEEAPLLPVETNDVERPLHILTLSAKSEKALKDLTQRYQAYLQSHPEALLADVCFTANTGRSHFEHRLAAVAESTVQLTKQLSACATEKEIAGLVKGQANSEKHPKIAFLFTGQGSQYIGMGRLLYETQPSFRAAIDRADEILRPYLEKPLLSVLYPATAENSLLNQTAYTQPALFALEYALFELWKSWGITPNIVMGHSLGEYVAACVAGVFSLEDGLRLVAERSRLMQSLPQEGEMVAVFADYERVASMLAPYASQVVIASVNGSENIVISGAKEAVK
ncbi:type I polyketide synthase, partial [Nostoc sp.]